MTREEADRDGFPRSYEGYGEEFIWYSNTVGRIWRVLSRGGEGRKHP